jgi:hypothetical protein
MWQTEGVDAVRSGRVDVGHLAASVLTGFLRPVVDSFRSHGFHGRIPEFE